MSTKDATYEPVAQGERSKMDEAERGGQTGEASEEKGFNPEDNVMSNSVRKFRVESQKWREFLAELIGTFVLVAFGDAVVAQVVLSGKGGGFNTPTSHGDWASINWGWGVGVILGILVCGGVSGAHLNPAVTGAMALVGKFDPSKVIHYMLAQYLGAFLGAAAVYGVYADAFAEAFEAASIASNGTVTHAVPGTAGIFATYPAAYLSLSGGMVDQIFGTMMLLLLVCAITDPRNMNPGSALVPLYVGFTVLNIGICFGMNCGYAINPARDLGPRLFTAIAGWGSETFTYGGYFFFVPILGPHIGGFLGALLYSILVENHWPAAS